MKKKSFALSKVYQLLEPGPVVMVTTAHKGIPNVMTMAWHMMVDFEPPLVAFVMAADDYSFKALTQTKECVINIPTEELAEKMVEIGKISGAQVDKFKKFNLGQEPASLVHAPLIPECYANLECKVVDMSMAGKYNIFIVAVVKAWVTPLQKQPRTLHHWGNGFFSVDGKIVKFPFKSRG